MTSWRRQAPLPGCPFWVPSIPFLQPNLVGVRVPLPRRSPLHTSIRTSSEDVVRRIQMGYSLIALKAIAKTLSMTMKMAQVAHEHGLPCLCADLTVNIGGLGGEDARRVSLS